MLKTTIDLNIYGKVFNAFKDKKENNEEDDIYFSLLELRKFLKKETAINYFGKGQTLDLIELELLKDLTLGAGEFNPLPLQCDFKMPNTNNTFSPETPSDSIFFLSEENKEEQKKYEQNNGYFIAFQDNYIEKWNELSFYGKKDEINISNHFKSWDEIEEYTLPFTDVLVYDNYIFAQKDRITPNFIKLIEVIDKKTPVSYNLLVVTHKVDEIWGSWPNKKNKFLTTIKVNDVFKFVNDLLSVKKLKSKLGIIILDRKHREHDRRIFFNYFRIKSGDSFYNYFDEDGTLITDGDSIDFKKYVKPEYHANSIIALDSISQKIQPVLKTPVLKKLFSCGNLTNQLLTHPKNKGRIV